jgi:hypothetical protein
LFLFSLISFSFFSTFKFPSILFSLIFPSSDLALIASLLFSLFSPILFSDFSSIFSANFSGKFILVSLLGKIIVSFFS